MGRRDSSLTIALCLSLVAHGGVGVVLLERVTAAEKGRIAQSAIERGQVAIGPVFVQEDRKELLTASVKPPETEKLPEMARKTEVTPLPKPEPVPLKSVFGDPTGHGDAEHGAPGEKPMQALRSAPENQAFLSRDPSGAGRVGDAPSKSTAPPGQQGNGNQGRKRVDSQAGRTGGPAAQPLKGVGESRGVRSDPAPDIPFGVPSEKMEAVVPRKPAHFPKGPAPNPHPVGPLPEYRERGKEGEEYRERKEAAQAPPAPKPVVASITPVHPEQPAQLESGGRAGSTSPAADPARQSDSEADAFGKVANVNFQDGRVEAQFGRRIKTVRPKLLLSAEYEIFTHTDPRVLLTAKVDATGHVTKVDVYQSSGTPDLDQPCLVAVYDWWFEPPKDKDGKPMADVVVVAITFRTR